MKKIFESMVQSNFFFQVVLLAVKRFFKVSCSSVFLLFLMVFCLITQMPTFVFKGSVLLLIQSLYLWYIGRMAKPSLFFPSCGSLLTSSRIGFLCALFLLLSSMENQFFYGIFISFFIALWFIFLVNQEDTGLFKKMIFFIRYSFFWIGFILLFLLLSSYLMNTVFSLAGVVLVGYVLVCIQLIIVKSMCENNDVYYYQGL